MTNIKANMDAFRIQEIDLKAKQNDLRNAFEKKSKEIKNMQSRSDNKLFLFGDKVIILIILSERFTLCGKLYFSFQNLKFIIIALNLRFPNW